MSGAEDTLDEVMCMNASYPALGFALTDRTHQLVIDFCL